MSFQITKSSMKKEIQKEWKSYLVKNCTEKIKDFSGRYSTIYLFKEDETKFIIPLLQYNHILGNLPFLEKTLNVTTNFELYTKETCPSKIRDQDVVLNEAIKRLTDSGVVLLNLFTSFGKTKIATKLIQTFGVKTLFITGFSTLYTQTKDEMLSTSNLRVVILTTQNISKIINNYDVFICGVKKASNYTEQELLPFKMIIWDEAHRETESGVKLLQKTYPRYLLGLTATPDKSIDYLKHYFGDQDEFITRTRTDKVFKVVKVETNIKIISNTTIIGSQEKIDFTDMLKQISNNKYISFIVKNLCEQNKKNKIIVMCNRIKLCRDIHDKLGDQSELFIEKIKKSSLTGKRILIAHNSKAGTGFDDASYNMMIICYDTKDVRQSEGRLRKDFGLVFDLVHQNFLLKKHWELRKQWYLESGAEIETQKITDCHEVSFYESQFAISKSKEKIICSVKYENGKIILFNSEFEKSLTMEEFNEKIENDDNSFFMNGFPLLLLNGEENPKYNNILDSIKFYLNF